MLLLGWSGRIFILAEKSEEAAIAAIHAIREKALLLEQFPNMGKMVDEECLYRELLIPFGEAGYVFIYEVIDKHVYILAIKHQREAGYERISAGYHCVEKKISS